MAKTIKLCSLLLMLTFLIGCNSDQWPTNMDTINIVETPEYIEGGKYKETLGLNSPSAMQWVNESLYITDTGNDRIVVIDREGNVIRTFGEPGNGPLQFIKPTGITADADHNIYIVDSGNNRIQVIDQKDQLIKQYQISEFPYSPKSSEIKDVAYLNQTLYATTRTMEQSWATVIAISNDESIQTIGESLIGHVAAIGNTLYFVSEGEFIKTKDARSFESGRNYLLTISPNDEITDIHEIPYKYTAGGIEGHEQHLYMFSKSYFSVDRYDLNGNYVNTVYRFRGELDELMGLTTLTFAGNDIFVLNSMTNTVYYLQKATS